MSPARKIKACFCLFDGNIVNFFAEVVQCRCLFSADKCDLIEAIFCGIANHSFDCQSNPVISLHYKWANGHLRQFGEVRIPCNNKRMFLIICKKSTPAHILPVVIDGFPSYWGRGGVMDYDGVSRRQIMCICRLEPVLFTLLTPVRLQFVDE